jgi:hypothetical protein
MERRIIWRPQAEAELLDAMQYYEQRRDGLGDEFSSPWTPPSPQSNEIPSHFRRFTTEFAAR